MTGPHPNASEPVILKVGDQEYPIRFTLARLRQLQDVSEAATLTGALEILAGMDVTKQLRVGINQPEVTEEVIWGWDISPFEALDAIQKAMNRALFGSDDRPLPLAPPIATATIRVGADS